MIYTIYNILYIHIIAYTVFASAENEATEENIYEKSYEKDWKRDRIISYYYYFNSFSF